MKNKLSVFKRFALNIHNQLISTEAKLHKLQVLAWECTLRCNLNCQHCGSDCRKTPTIADMPAIDFLNTTKKIARVYDPKKIMIQITGGEPLLRNDLEVIGYQLYKQGYSWGMVSNGYFLTRERFKTLIQSGMRSITISLDGLEDSHNWLRQNSKSFEKALNAIDIIVNQQDMVYDVVTCINQKNFDELENLKKLLIDHSVKKWRIFTIAPIGRAAQNEQLNISNIQFKQLMEFIKHTRTSQTIDVSYGCEGFLGEYETQVRDGYFFRRAGINIGSILIDGSISACPNIDRAFAQGNIYNNDFVEVWENNFEIMRNRKWTKTGICATCKVYKWCKGNGMHLRLANNDEPLRCHYNLIQ